MSDGASVVALLNEYELWRLETRQVVYSQKNEDNEDIFTHIFTFEVWLNTEVEKDRLFDALKVYVDEYGEMIDWHECTHDEAVHTPCVIAETYVRSE